MNKWTILSVVVLIGILSLSLWLITQSQDPLLEAESAAEQEIGVEEFDSASENPVGADSDAEIIMEPDLSIDGGSETDEPEAVPADPVDDADPDATEAEKSPEPSESVSP